MHCLACNDELFDEDIAAISFVNSRGKNQTPEMLAYLRGFCKDCQYDMVVDTDFFTSEWHEKIS
jgi:hypothetical protein